MAKKKKKAERFLVYLIAAVMLLSALSYIGSRTIEPWEAAQPLDALVQYEVAPVGNTSTLVAVSSQPSDYIAIPMNPQFITRESLAYVLANNISGVVNTTLEYTNAYVFFRFRVSPTFEGENDVTSLLDSEVRGYSLYRVYGGEVSGTPVELVGTPELEEGDTVKAFLFRRADNAKMIAIQEEKPVVEGLTEFNVSEVNSTAFEETTE